MEFFATHIWQILAFVVSFGAIGIGVAIFFVGIPAMVLVGYALGSFKQLLEFLQTPVGQVCAIGAAIVVAFWLGDIRGTRVEKALWVASDLAAQLKKSQLEAKIASDTAADAAARLSKLELEDGDLKRKVADYEKSNVHDRACLIGDRAPRLRDIAGQPEARDKNPRRLRPPGKASRGAAR